MANAVSFISPPTPPNDSATTNVHVPIDVSINATNISSVILDWNGTNYSLFDSSLCEMFGFNNNPAIGESSAYFVDTSLYGNNASCSNSSSDVDGPTPCPAINSSGMYGSALQFNGSQTLASTARNIPITGDESRTISFWAYPFDTSGHQYLLGWGSNTGGGRFAVMMRDEQWYIWSYGAGHDWPTGIAPQADAWTDVTVTFDGSNEYLYIDGQLMNSSAVPALNTPSTPLTMGHALDNGNTSYVYQGLLDEVEIWNRTLSPGEVYQVYASNLYKLNSTQWFLDVDQGANATTGLSPGTYTYQAFASDLMGEPYQTEQRTLQVVPVDSETNLSEWWMFGRYLNHTAWDGVSYPTVPGLDLANFSTGEGTEIDSSPAIANGSVYIGSEYGSFYQLNASNVSQNISNFPLGTSYWSSPAVAGGYVYAGSYYNKYLYQLNASNISQNVSQFPIAGTNNFIESSPVVAYGFAYIGTAYGVLDQLNASNVSQLIASFSMANDYIASPVISDGYLYAPGQSGDLYQLNATDVGLGPINTFTAPAYGLFLSSPIVAGGIAYIGDSNGVLYQLNSSTLSLIANSSAGTNYFSSPAFSDGYIYIGDRGSSGYVFQFNASNVSQQIANFSTGSPVQSSPAVENGFVYIGSNNGYVYQLNASNISQQIANFSTGGPVYSSPAVANGYVYVGSDTGYLYQLNASYIGVSTSSPPTQGSPVLNSTTGANTSDENLTVYNQSTVGATKNIINWYQDASELEILNMPFEGGSNSTWTRDYSDNGHNGTVIGATWDGTGGYDGMGAYQLDGASDWIDASGSADLDFTSNFTVSFWVKPSLADAGADSFIIDKRRTSDPWRTFGFYLYNNKVYFEIWSIPRDDTIISSSSNLTSGLWYHVAGVFNGTGISLYVDGDQENSSPTASTDIQPSDDDIRIGNLNSNPTDYFNGSIDDVVAYNRALSAREILALYGNRTDLMVSQELAAGDVWKACITPNDRTQDGATACSNSVTVLSAQNCPVINEPGTYTMARDFSGAPNNFSFIGNIPVCVYINSSDVVFDCNGHSIANGNLSAENVGILSYPLETNVTIRNCQNVSNYYIGLFIASSNSTVINNTAYNALGGFYMFVGSNNIISNNTAYNDAIVGFIQMGSTNDTITGNAAYGNGDGFEILNDFDDSLIADNLVYNNSNDGFFVDSSFNDTFSGNTVYGNAADGLYLGGADGSSLNDMSFYNNGADMIADGGAGAFSYSMTNTTFLNPLGTYENHTTLDISDALGGDESYSVSWSSNVSALPSGATSFAQKFVAISSLSGAPSIDSIRWSWEADELNASYNETQFNIWAYEGSWTGLSAVRGNHSLSVTGLGPAGTYGILQGGTMSSTPGYSSGHGQTLKHISWTTDFNCSDGELTATASDGAAGMELRLVGTSNAFLDIAQSDQGGNAVFSIPQSGTFKIFQPSTGGYAPYTSDPFELTLCPGTVSANSTTNSPPANNTPINPPQQNATISPTPNQTSNSSGQIANQTSPPPNPAANATGQNQASGPSLQDANSAISSASTEISDAGAAGKNTSAAQSKLDSAKAAVASGDYADAIILADSAKQLALNAAAAPPPQGNQTGNVTVPKAQPSNLWLAGIAVIVIFCGAGYYLITRKKQRSE